MLSLDYQNKNALRAVNGSGSIFVSGKCFLRYGGVPTNNSYFRIAISPWHKKEKYGNSMQEGGAKMMSEEMTRSVATPLVDIRDVQIDSELPQEERMRSFISQIKNPYCFKVGAVVVKVAYSDGGVSLNERFAEMLSIL